MTDLHQGGCQCGSLRYRFQAPLRDIAHCHCTICRRSSGGLVVTWITVPRAAFEWLRGEPGEYASSATCTRYFCRDCGAQLALFTRHSPETLDVTIGTLDEPEHAPADRHIWVGTRLPWLNLDPQLPDEEEEHI
ncbi:GFA family protein [Pseudomonas sp. RIT-PI-AD]|uniref:GFA family protein n=1 Tax=Pseudomonas sp. RIT-PI-AD TaxID=3035294 RepID=UPI0021DA1CD2|nr:GFA family protein [Pseudomonas sp. RIT-PI-AD]